MLGLSKQIFPYPCIRWFHFAKLKMWRLSPYQDLLRTGKSRKDAIFLDIGCCVGNDARKLVADGYPLEQVVTSDLRQEFADIGHKLFRTTQGTYPIAFVPGDAFDPKHLDTVPPLASVHEPTDSPEGSALDLCSLTSLNPLQGRVFAIHASSFFHLFSEERQLYVARALAGLLSPEPGSVIFGLHVGNPEKGFITSPGIDRPMFCHCPESWAQLWDGIVFEKGVVDVKAKLVQMGREEPDGQQSAIFTVLVWSVTRL